MRRLDWRRALPPRRGWAQLLASPSSVALTFGFLLTVASKASVLRAVEAVRFWPAVLPWAVANDAVVYLGMAAMFAVVEGARPALRFLTIPMAAWFASLAFINAGVLSVTGEQLTGQSFELGLHRFRDLWLIASHVVRSNVAATVLLAVALVGVPLVLRWRLGQGDANERPRAHCAALVAGLGLLISLLWPAPRALPARHIGGNATLGWDALLANDAGDFASDQFAGYAAPRLVSDEEIARVAAQAVRPNAVLIILESTRFDHTSLGKHRQRATPALARLAREGSNFVNARAVVPHTTKSVFSMLCGRFPLMQIDIFEYAKNLDVQCAPDVLTKAGYRTAFFQGAWGVFEEGPRLADKLGFDHFAAWEDMQGETVGYFASDDRSLLRPAQRWIDAQGDAPFFLTVHTSAAHHPYELPKGEPQAGMSEEERAVALVEMEDQLVGQLLAFLDERGLADNTIVIAVADHGEGFGTKGVRQHDNNYYEEGLHVPFVVRGPNVPVRTVSENVTLADLAPSLLGLLGVRILDDAKQQLAGMDLFSGTIGERMLMFSCYYELRCRGFVKGRHKVVLIPHTGRRMHFDLVADANENDPNPLPSALDALVANMNTELDKFRTRSFKMELGPTRPYGAWRCPRGRLCTHPNARPL